jgi:hypothetical protein
MKAVVEKKAAGAHYARLPVPVRENEVQADKKKDENKKAEGRERHAIS